MTRHAPVDPALPGLAWAVSLGTLRVHRPGRRAIVETACGSFVKVVEPHRLARLRSRYDQLSHVELVPDVELADEELGVLVLARRPGTTLRRALLADRPVPSAADLEEALQPIWRAGLVHGDFHDANVLVDGGAITGLIDVDRASRGHPARDLATLLAHLDALAIYRPSGAPPVDAYARWLRNAWAPRFDLEPLVTDRRESLAARAEQLGRTREAAALRRENEAALWDRLAISASRS